MLKPALQLRLGAAADDDAAAAAGHPPAAAPMIELQAQVQQALESNVMLEAEEPETPTEAAEAADSTTSSTMKVTAAPTATAK